MWIHIISNRLTQLYFVILFPAIFPLAAWGEQSSGSPDAGKPTIAADVASQKEKLDDGSQKEQAFENVNWGLEVNLDELVAMAKKGQIVEIQWHIMHNILRAHASDGRIYHIRNENKGIDLRKTLINAGVKIGKEGVLFRYLF
jgi:hypothetical protein